MFYSTGNKKEKNTVSACLLAILAVPRIALAQGEFEGSVIGEFRYFTRGIYEEAGQEQFYPALHLMPEYYYSSEDQVVSLSLYYLHDDVDDERTHFDVKEAYWLYLYEDMEFKLGFDVVFWGIAESNHLVDIINQTDLVVAPDGEDKLGQSMLSVSWAGDYGVADFYVLPGFRKRTFPGEAGRFRVGLTVESAEYESSREKNHIDYAFRWSQSIDLLEMAISYFNGTARVPILKLDNDSGTATSLIAFYEQIARAGLEIQGNVGSWILKSESIYQDSEQNRYFASVSGFEYTFHGIFDSVLDVGVLLEYSYDSRGEENVVGLQNDLFAATRLAINSVSSTEILTGAVYDMDDGSSSFFIEARTRLSSDLFFSLESRIYTNIDAGNAFYPIRNDDYLEVRLEWFF